MLLRHLKQLRAAQGELRVLGPSEPVLAVLRLSGIADLLLAKATVADAATTQAPVDVRRREVGGVAYETYDLAPSSLLAGSLCGAPEDFDAGRLAAHGSQPVTCTHDLIAVGLGAFLGEEDDGVERFGESLAVAGAAVTCPTDGSSLPDYQVAEGQLVPEMQLLYGITARGEFSQLMRFEAAGSPRGVVGFGDLVEAALGEVDSPSAAIVVVAESASVVGATLQRSPTTAQGRSPLAFPEVRDWLSFTTERTDERNVVLIVGVVERSPTPETAPFVRPVGPGTDASGHFHAVVFPYRPVPKGRVEMAETVHHLLDTETARTVLHLLADRRTYEGAGQTDLLRGACWVAPLQFRGGRYKHL